MAVIFTTCLIASNLFAVKLFSIFGKFTLSGAVIVFPISYIINDCLAEIYGYRKTQLVIWLGFAMNLGFVLVSQLVLILPGAPFWQGQESFEMVFGAAPRVVTASLLAFLVGSTLNSMVMSRKKIADKGEKFWLRAILSSMAGEAADCLIFVPIVFFNMGWEVVLITMACQFVAKVFYEILVLPLTSKIVKTIKEFSGIDTYDEGINYNPFRIND